MLALMRRKANSWLMTALFGAIIFVFAVNFGPWAGSGSGELPFAAEVNGSVITMAQFQSVYSGKMRQIQQFRPDYTAEQADKDGMRGIIVDQLIAQELLAQLAQEHGLAISDRDLAVAVKERIFGAEKPFDLPEYERIVNSYLQMTPSQFEKQLRRELLAEQAANLVATGGHISNEELRQVFRLKNTKASVDFVRIDPTKIVLSARSDDEANKYAAGHTDEIAAYYEENNALYSDSQHKKSLDEAKLDIAKALLLTDAQKIEAQRIAQGVIADLKSGVALDRIGLDAKIKGLSKSTTGLFSKGEARASSGLSKEIQRAAFSLSKDNATSNQVFDDQGMMVVIRLKEMVAADDSKFEAEKVTLIENLGYQRKSKFVQEYIDYLKKQARVIYNENLHKPTV